MPHERTILCGDVPQGNGDTKSLRLRLWGTHQNVSLCIDDIRRQMLRDVPPQFLDLIEIATYVYCTDQAVTRGGDGVLNFGNDWRRRFFFKIPVRNPDLWNRSDLRDVLSSTLGFLSEDEYHFEFTKLEKGPDFQQYLGFSEDDAFFEQPEEVVLFSGGLDSLGGAIQELVIDKRKIVLVTHKSSSKLEKRRRHLRELLAERSHPISPFHIPVRINKDKKLSREFTQRSRSFLYASLGATIAQMFGLSRIKFYENGIVSLNLPFSTQVVGARATRTTHPQVINGFATILSCVANKRFTVENPFFWRTKTDVLELIAKAECTEMIKFATSCTRTWEMTKLHSHCGTCSQCIDRRFAVLAAGLNAADPEDSYKVDLILGEREEGEVRNMLAAYVETASAIKEMTPVKFFARYGEVSRLLRHLEGSADSTALRIFKLHQRHAEQVTKVIDDGIGKHASAIRERKLPSTCLLRMVCDLSSPVVAGIVSRHEASGTSVALKDNVFRRKGQAWKVRFAGGEDFILLPTKGAAYLHYLLSNPGTAFPVTDIIFHIAKEPNRYALGDAGEGSDRDAMAAYHVKYEGLQEELEEARRNNDEDRKEKILSEMDFLAQHIKQDQGLGGRLRKVADDRDRVRKSFRNAISRTLKEIARSDKRLAEHLKSPRLKCGWKPCYNPYGEIKWDT